MSTKKVLCLSGFVVLGFFGECSFAAPACVNPDATNFVIANATGDLTENGYGGMWLLQSVDTSERIFLRRCTEGEGNTCYYATNVKPGKYYFKEAIPNGSSRNSLEYPVSTAKLWFPITGMGVDYIGHWTIRRSNRIIDRLEISYDLSNVDKAIELCKIKNKKLYLDRTKSLANEVVD